MQLHFHKYQGTGNDFIMIDNRQHFFIPDKNRIAQLCHRRFGIGADGLILLENTKEADFLMRYYNADGSEGSMCGNGGRCTVQFAADLKIIKQKTTFMAIDGLHEAFIEKGLVKLKMKDVEGIEKDPQNAYFLDTGSPHYVAFVENLDSFDVYQEGKKIRYNDRFQEKGTNVNFVEKINQETIYVRTYERGVEDETYSCGTGVTAAAIVFSTLEKKKQIQIQTKGGNLSVSFEQIGNDTFQQIYLVGLAKKVFEGSLNIKD
ncbi:MAG: diaminopimelate epimerase [Cytophagales bacterium]|nr:MAG: diaminopimelate epimerase [Cytophagales bacterium]